MQCAICHAEVGPQSAFCNSCGAPVAAAAAGPADTSGYSTVNAGAPPVGYAAPPAYGAAPPYTGPTAASSGLSDNVASALAYVTIIPAIIFLVLEPYNKVPLIKFHSWQSIGLCVASIVIQIALTILQIALHFIPLIGLLFVPVHLLVGLGIFLLWIFVIIKASRGEWYKLPVIGDFAEKQARS
ncbi:hypothetical protein AciX9_0745 [Granulicella tundricola MP5ACTX9]|uniref:Zinc-ribbon domain-containing protein n=1 Tax=Granulicella tundricola (strain ATCC BAA-1859 / DSM 23138 / MP5ACTX9) TaxID=1198114 RepID=E8X0F1_GRATM|nr:hypothetical protein AciX9_0745 [Granulicella tundricola MP5ACTX9]